jgi:hypothetical protein
VSTLANHALIAAVLGTVVLILLIVYRGRLQTAWGGNVVVMVQTLTLVGVVLIANALLRLYVY